MDKDLTNSVLVRQNVLNNIYAVEEIQKAVGIKGVLFEQSYRFVKKQLADFYGVTERTIENCLEKIYGNKTPQLGIFDFRAFLNVGMLLTDSERARMGRRELMNN